MPKTAAHKRKPLPEVYECTPIKRVIYFHYDQAEAEQVDRPESLREYPDNVKYYKYRSAAFKPVIGTEIPMADNDIIRLHQYRLITITFEPIKN